MMQKITGKIKNITSSPKAKSSLVNVILMGISSGAMYLVAEFKKHESEKTILVLQKEMIELKHSGLNRKENVKELYDADAKQQEDICKNQIAIAVNHADNQCMEKLLESDKKWIQSIILKK